MLVIILSEILEVTGEIRLSFAYRKLLMRVQESPMEDCKAVAQDSHLIYEFFKIVDRFATESLCLVRGI